LGKEHLIPKNGINASIEVTYNPNNSGFGERYKKDLKPLALQ
jgi:hypothetical protein